MRLIKHLLLLIIMVSFVACKHQASSDIQVPAVAVDSAQAVADSASSNDSGSFSFLAYDEPPVLIHSTQAVYPPNYRKSGIQGNVVLDVEVLEDGSVGTVKVRNSLLSGKGGLDDVAIATVKTWKFRPALKDQTPVSANIVQIVEFKLN